MKTIDANMAAALLPLLATDDNKYTRGVCELVVGEPMYAGAGVLATMAASRSGAGYIEVYACAETAAALRVVQPSCVCWPLETYAECIHPTSSRHPRAAVVGCGFGGCEASDARVMDVLENAYQPVLIDGGGISALSTEECKAQVKSRFVAGYPTVVTPHGGEAARIIASLDVPSSEQRAEQAKALGVPVAALDALLIARAFGVVCVLKGPNTYIADGDEETVADVLQLTCGTPALAKAGTGDVLAGVIGSLMAQDVAVKDACALGVFLHAKAGALAAKEFSPLCVTAEEVAKHIPYAIRALEKKRKL